MLGHLSTVTLVFQAHGITLGLFPSKTYTNTQFPCLFWQAHWATSLFSTFLHLFTLPPHLLLALVQAAAFFPKFLDALAQACLITIPSPTPHPPSGQKFASLTRQK